VHEATHAASRPHVCRFCDYRANAPSKLKVHERSHTGEKPFKCDFCPYRANNSSAVRRHEACVHAAGGAQ
jgi:KRAB domain-containing zinc finger protein